MTRARVMGCGIKALAVAAVGGLSATSAQAGTMFQNAVYSCNVGDQTHFRYDWVGLLNRHTTERRWIDCGVQRHSQMTGTHIDSATIYFTDRSANDDLTCEMRVIAEDGTTRFTGQTQTSFGAVGLNSFTWKPPGVAGYAYIWCWLPAAAGTSVSSMSGVYKLITEGHNP